MLQLKFHIPGAQRYVCWDHPLWEAKFLLVAKLGFDIAWKSHCRPLRCLCCNCASASSTQTSMLALARRYLQCRLASKCITQSSFIARRWTTSWWVSWNGALSVSSSAAGRFFSLNCLLLLVFQNRGCDCLPDKLFRDYIWRSSSL